MVTNNWDTDYEMRKGGSPDGYINCLKVWQIFAIQ